MVRTDPWQELLRHAVWHWPQEDSNPERWPSEELAPLWNRFRTGGSYLPPLFFAELAIAHLAPRPTTRANNGHAPAWLRWMKRWRSLAHSRGRELHKAEDRRLALLQTAGDLSIRILIREASVVEPADPDIHTLLRRHADRWCRRDSERLRPEERELERVLREHAENDLDPEELVGHSRVLSPPEFHGHLDPHAVELLDGRKVLENRATRLPGSSGHGRQHRLVRAPTGEFLERSPATFPYDNPGRLDVYELSLLGVAPTYFWQRFADAELLQSFGRRTQPSTQVPALVVDLDLCETEAECRYPKSPAERPVISWYRATLCGLLHTLAQRTTACGIDLRVRLRRWPVTARPGLPPEIHWVDSRDVRTVSIGIRPAVRWLARNAPGFLGDLPVERVSGGRSGGERMPFDAYSRVLFGRTHHVPKTDGEFFVRGWREGLAVRQHPNGLCELGRGDPTSLHRVPMRRLETTCLEDLCGHLASICLRSARPSRSARRNRNWELAT